jgi:acyl carrier protein
MELQAIQKKVKDFILSEFLEGEDPEALTDKTELISSGVLDSLATLKLVTFLEQTFDITVQAHEADADHLNTLEIITGLVKSKMKK